MDLGNLAKMATDAINNLKGAAGGVTSKAADAAGDVAAHASTTAGQATSAVGNMSVVSELVTRAQAIMADGKVTPDEVKQQLSDLAAKAGISQDSVAGVVEKVMSMMSKGPTA